MTTGVQLIRKQKTSKQNRAFLTGAFFVGTVLSWLRLGEKQLIFRMENGEYMMLKIKKNHPKARVPHFALEGDAGMDLYSIENKILKPFQVMQIRTGIEMELPSKTVGLIWDKSGIATKHSISVMGGVFDENYRGELIVSLINLSNIDYKIKSGDKIAQLLIQKIEHPKVVEAEELSETVRGRGRLGSTGIS